MDDMRCILKVGNKYRVRIKHNKKLQSIGTFSTLEEAISARDGFLKHKETSITPSPVLNSFSSNSIKHEIPHFYGINHENNIDINCIWEMAELVFSQTEEKEKQKNASRIEFSNKPIAIAMLSDLHIGNSTTDYKQLRKDAELIQKTDGMYAIFHGDGIDNWIVPKLAQLQRGQAINFENELLLFKSWIATISSKLIIVVAGNHDNWTYNLSGIDVVKQMLQTTKVLYDPYEIRTIIQVGSKEWVFCIRHKWLGSSIYNPTHGIERYARMGATFDVGIGGHTHIASLSREFVGNDSRQCMAIITGTYKRYDSFAKQIGFPFCPHNGSGALILNTDGKMMWIRDLEQAAEYITYLRNK